MNNITTPASAMDSETLRQRATHAAVRESLSEISQKLYNSYSLELAEDAIDEAGDLIGLRWCWWTPDAASPYDNKRAKEFSVRNGWPPELMGLWRKYRVSLYSPLHIRSRFEILPYVTFPDLREQQTPCPGYHRVNQILTDLGIQAMLHVPVHLAKGRIGLVNWAGEKTPAELREMMPAISGELLAIGYLFMRNYAVHFGQDDTVVEEKSRLTLREWDCLRMLAQGFREAEAAELLHISKSTLRFHVENAVRKFGCKNRTHVIAMTAQLGLLGPIGN